MPSQVVDAMNRFKQQLLAREQNQLTDMARQWLTVEQALDSKIAALSEEATRLSLTGRTLSRSKLYQLERYQSLLAQTNQELSKYTDYVEPLIINQQQSMAALGIQHAAVAIDASVESAVGVRFDKLPVSAVEHMVGLAGDGSPLRQLLVDSWPEAAQGLTDALLRGVALGQNPRVTARQMADGTTRSLNRMMTIARTEQLRTYKEASRAAYIESKIIKSYKRLSARDSRVCAGCLAADSREYPLGESFASHPNCRCTLLPILIGQPPIQFEDGATWFARQPENTQRDILGTGKFDLWRSGQVDFADFATVKHNNTWGDAVVPATLWELTA